MVHLEELLQVMRQTAHECGQVMLHADRAQIHQQEKSSWRDLVTDYDIKIQNMAVKRLEASYPQADFLCEEGQKELRLDGALLFIIDPIDGTANFRYDHHHSCISIACYSHGKAVAGVVYDPYLDELFHAVTGQGAYLNGEPIHVTELDLEHSLVLFGTSPFNPECVDETFELVKDIYRKSMDVRRSGSGALDLCALAAGRVGLFFEARLCAWDFAAGALIVEEAGGMCCDFFGRPLEIGLHKPSVLAGPRRNIHQSGILERYGNANPARQANGADHGSSDGG